MRKLLLTTFCLAAPIALAACGESTTSTTTSASAGSCTKADLTLKNAGTLTVGTDNPAFPPWFGGGEKAAPWKINDPASGEGFESAVVYAVAEKLGFDRADVKWTVVPFDKAFAPGPKDFDLLANQVSINPERAQNVTFSSGYYNVNQAVVALDGTPIAAAKTLADLKPYKFGAQVGTTSLSAIEERVGPDKDVAVYNNQDDAVNALENKQVDGIVVDLPTGFFVTAAQIEGSKIVGQFPQGTGTPEQFGLVMENGSPIAACVSQVVDGLRTDGTLEKLETQWLAGADAPFLK